MFSFVIVAEYGAPWTGAPGGFPSTPTPTVVDGTGDLALKEDRVSALLGEHARGSRQNHD